MIQFGANFSILGVPETGLSPVITIYDTSDGSVVINAVAMTEIANGCYKYDFTNNITKQYSIVIDGGLDTLDSRYMTAWSERAIAEAGIADILEDTNELQVDWVNGGRLDLLLDAIPTTAMRGTDSVPTNPLLTNDARLNNLDASVSSRATEVNATTNKETIQTDLQMNEDKIDSIDTVVDNIQVKTDLLPSDPADQSAVESAISTSQGVLTTAISTSEGNIRGGSDSLNFLSDQLDMVQADLDNPDQYKATGFSVPNEYDVALAGIQTDLDNPDQYKADVSGLPSAGEYDARLTAIQTDLDNPSQYQADISGVATLGDITASESIILSAVSIVEVKVDALDTLIDLLMENVERDLGLNNENTYIDTTVFDTDGNLTSARVRSYSVAGSVGTDSDVLATYQITAVGTGAGMFSTWKMVKI